MISCKDKKWMLFFIIPATILFQCFVYRAICKWPLYFTTLLLPEPFGSHYNDFITASDMPWLLYSIQLLLFLPVWFVLTGMFAPAGKWFEYERDAGKYVTQPGMYFKEGGTMDRLRNYYSPDTLQRYVSGVDPLQTPWIIGPDAQTNVPFIFAEGQFYGKFVVEGVNYERVWIKMFDGDLVSLDWSFPSGGYRKGSPVLIALHGMNGNSELSMIKDQVKRANDRGWTAVAVTQRGCDDTQIRNMLFNGEDAYKDLHVIAGVVRQCCENSLIIASGISFGGVTVANYPAIYGKESRVDGCVSVAGSPDLSVCAKYRYSHRAYTPGVAHCKKIQSCYDRRKLDILHRAGVDVEHVVSENCWDMVDWDTHVTCKLINKKDVFDAANAVSLAPSDLSDPRSQKPKNVTVPVLCVQVHSNHDLIRI